MICIKCGEEIEEGQKFCKNCGESVVEEPTPKEGEVEVLDSNTSPKKKNKLWLLGIPVIVLLLVGLGLILFCPSMFINGKKVVQKEISTVFDMAQNALDEVNKNSLTFDLDKDDLSITGDCTVQSNYKDEGIDLTKLKDYTFHYGGSISKKEEYANINVSLLKKNKTLLEIIGDVFDDELYISLKDIYNKSLRTDLDMYISDISMTSFNDFKDIETLLNKTESLIMLHLDEKDIEKKTVTKKINDKEEKVTQISYKLDLEKLEKILLKGYSKDEEVLKILSKLTNLDVEDVKSELEWALEYPTYEDVKLTMNIYIKGLNTVKEIELVGEGAQIVVNPNNNNYSFRVKSNNIVLLSGEYNKKNKELQLKSDPLTFTMKQKNKNTYTMEMKLEPAYMIGYKSIVLNAEIESKVLSSKEESHVTLALKIDDLEASIESNAVVEKNPTIKKGKAPTNYKYIDLLTAAEEEQIEEKLGEKLEEIIFDIFSEDALEELQNNALFRRIESIVKE